MRCATSADTISFASPLTVTLAAPSSPRARIAMAETSSEVGTRIGTSSSGRKQSSSVATKASRFAVATSSMRPASPSSSEALRGSCTRFAQ